MNGVRTSKVLGKTGDAASGSSTVYVGTVDGSIRMFNGTVDELRIWNRTLTGIEINASYQIELGKYNAITNYYANVTNLTSGNYTYYVWTNNTVGQVNQTIPRLVWVGPTAAAASTCTYSSGNWSVTNTDNCSITTNVNMGGNDIVITSAGGTFVVNSNITNVGKLKLCHGCQIVVHRGQRLG